MMKYLLKLGVNEVKIIRLILVPSIFQQDIVLFMMQLNLEVIIIMSYLLIFNSKLVYH